MMKTADVMSQEVISVAPDSTVAEAARIMSRERISGLPVIDSDHSLAGIVTEGDLLRRVELGTETRRPGDLQHLASSTAAADYVKSHSGKVADVMTRDVVVADEDMPLDEVVALMETRQIKRLPVLRDGRVVGIVARADLLHALAAAAPLAPAHPSDAEIRERLCRELYRQRWTARQANIVVRNGVVDLWGFIDSETARKAMRTAAEATVGVKEVRDHLIQIESFGQGAAEPDHERPSVLRQ